jgi:transcriptional/translational regulatory protein YebC/TACO1
VGLIEVPRESISEEELYEKAIEAGAEDVQVGEEIYLIYTLPEELYQVKEKLQSMGVLVEKAEITYKPNSTVPVNDSETAKKLLKLLEALEELEDVKEVIANFDMAEELIKQA